MIKAKAHRLNKPEDGNFGKVWNYICDQHEIKECYNKGFFNTMGGNLMAGDTVRMIEIRNNRILSLSEGIVLEVTKSKIGFDVEFYPLDKQIIRFPQGEAAKEKAPAAASPEFISGTGSVEWNLGKRTYVITADGKTVCEIDNKAEAHAIARGDQPIPVMA